MRQKRSRKPAFIGVIAANATRNKTVTHRFRAASFAGVLCAKRTAKNRWTDQKMNKFIFWLAIGFSYARKLSLRRSSYRRRLFVIVFKPVRPLRSRRRILLAQSKRARSARKGCRWQAFSVERAERPRARRPRTYFPRQFLSSNVFVRDNMNNLQTRLPGAISRRRRIFFYFVL